MAAPEQATLGQKVGGLLIGLSTVFCSMEMVPGWSVLHLGWPPLVYYCIMAVCGAAAGLLMAARHRLPGLAGGLVGGPGALLAIAVVLERTTWTHKLIFMVVGLIGALPGFAVYKILAAVESSFTPSTDESQANPGEGAAMKEPQEPPQAEGH